MDRRNALKASDDVTLQQILENSEVIGDARSVKIQRCHADAKLDYSVETPFTLQLENS